MNPEARRWIDQLGLKPHPEGGYYSEVYRSDEVYTGAGLPSRYTGDRPFGTSIYFLVTSSSPSRFHRLASDEVWYFHAGSRLTVHLLADGGEYAVHFLGDLKSPNFQLLLPRGVWFGAEVELPQNYSLISCAVMPGFDFADFELGEREHLLSAYPAQRELVLRLTAPAGDS